MADNHIAEEQLVDFVLGHLDELQAKRVSNHLADCKKCYVEWQSWQGLLTNEVDFKPSEQLSERLASNLDQLEESKQKKLNRSRQKRWVLGFVLLTMIFCSFILSGMFKSQNSSYQVLQNEEISSHDIQQQVATNQIEISSIQNGDHISGQVWLNPYTEEILIEVSGLSPLSSRDYQMWIKDGNDAWIGELLQLKNGGVRILYQGQDV